MIDDIIFAIISPKAMPRHLFGFERSPFLGRIVSLIKVSSFGEYFGSSQYFLIKSKRRLKPSPSRFLYASVGIPFGPGLFSYRIFFNALLISFFVGGLPSSSFSGCPPFISSITAGLYSVPVLLLKSLLKCSRKTLAFLVSFFAYVPSGFLIFIVFDVCWCPYSPAENSFIAFHAVLGSVPFIPSTSLSFSINQSSFAVSTPLFTFDSASLYSCRFLLELENENIFCFVFLSSISFLMILFDLTNQFGLFFLVFSPSVISSVVSSMSSVSLWYGSTGSADWIIFDDNIELNISFFSVIIL